MQVPEREVFKKLLNFVNTYCAYYKQFLRE